MNAIAFKHEIQSNYICQSKDSEKIPLGTGGCLILVNLLFEGSQNIDLLTYVAAK